MVAYTSPDCIPYAECSDSVCLNTGTVCEPSTVWCDQAEVIEARLDTFDQIVTRTADTVPMVFMARSSPFTHLAATFTGTTYEFTEVVVDTDDMANLDVNNTGFTVQTPGLYQVVVYLFGLTQTAGSDMGINVTFSLSPASPPINGISNGSLQTTYGATFDDILVTPQIHMTIPFFAGQISSLVITTGADAADSVTFSYAMMAATWMADLPL